MSRIGKNPIAIPEGATVEVADNVITVKGKLGEMRQEFSDVEVTVAGEINPDTGYVVDLKELKKVIHDLVISKVDHKNLNEEVEPFDKLNPTAENMVVVIWNLLRKKIDKNLKLTIQLYETPRNFVTYDGT